MSHYKSFGAVLFLLSLSMFFSKTVTGIKESNIVPVNRDSIEYGYMDKISYNPGDTALIYISFSCTRVHGQLHLYTVEGKPIDNVFCDLTKQNINSNKPWENGFGFQVTFTYIIPQHLESGIYNWENRLFFIVKNKFKDADITIIYPSNTEEAYNEAGSKSLYDFNSAGGRASIVSFQRPLSYYSIVNIRTYCKRFLEWMHGLIGYNIQYIADMDMDDFREIQKSRIVIVIGHSEYWSRNARINFDAFVNSGKDAIILSGNTMWWQVRYSNDTKRLICYKDSVNDPESDHLLKTINWPISSLEFPVLNSIGMDFNHGAYGMKDYHGWMGYKILKPDSPLLAGTGVDFHDIVSCQSEEYDATLFTRYPGDDDPVVDTIALGFCKIELIGYDWGKSIYGAGLQKSYGTFIALKKDPWSGNIINVGFSNWCSRYGGQGAWGGFGGIDSAKIKMITLNMMNLLLSGTNIFTDPKPCAITSIEQKTANNKIFPNPNNGTFAFVFDKPLSEDTFLRIFNHYGNEVHSQKLKNIENSLIDITRQPEGIYYYLISNGQGMVASGKIMKSN